MHTQTAIPKAHTDLVLPGVRTRNRGRTAFAMQQVLALHSFLSTSLIPAQSLTPQQVIELPLKHPELFEALGIAQPKGVLLWGPPGTGKTLLARAVAHHTDCTFIRVSGGELVQKYIGEGSRMVRELFVMAR